MQVLKEDVRENILAAAKKLFLSKGFEGASMSMIAKEAGVSKSNLYNYFPAKEALFQALVQTALAQITQMMQVIFDHSSEGFDPKAFSQRTAKALTVVLVAFREEILLLTDASAGTAFEKTKEGIIQQLQAHSLHEFQHFQIETKEDQSFFIHYVNASFVEGLVEVLRHYQNDEWVARNVEMLTAYYIHGYYFFFADTLS
ncbi:TetR/AcrR family transcriptional regulator [Anoxynatronum buryatiense]|uniref:Transcriptional regulator, TetR family n=1 Tax=Anoxynatronum buryatiense TaxID=489973 RepID=A0AA46AIL4_9CLOT|nr:TetR/AcrR family transcriptional regulator [Anoxynatronum buryatiense]SMP51028.1 transcriptional regulator, TetR family [Anoxynatronum buryatiense]